MKLKPKVLVVVLLYVFPHVFFVLYYCMFLTCCMAGWRCALWHCWVLQVSWLSHLEAHTLSGWVSLVSWWSQCYHSLHLLYAEIHADVSAKDRLYLCCHGVIKDENDWIKSFVEYEGVNCRGRLTIMYEVCIWIRKMRDKWLLINV